MAHSIEITGVDTKTINGFDDVVCRIRYTLTWTNSDSSAVSEDFSLLLVDPDDTSQYPDTSGFTAFDSITETQMKGWIEADAAFEGFTRSLSQRIIIAPTPSTSSPALPWAS